MGKVGVGLGFQGRSGQTSKICSVRLWQPDQRPAEITPDLTGIPWARFHQILSHGISARLHPALVGLHQPPPSSFRPTRGRRFVRERLDIVRAGARRACLAATLPGEGTAEDGGCARRRVRASRARAVVMSRSWRWSWPAGILSVEVSRSSSESIRHIFASD